MKLTFRLFAILDLICFLFMSAQIWTILTLFSEIKTDTFSIVKVTLTFLIYLSLLASAAGQFQFKKYGMIVYYIQFPFRLFLLVFSIGFITLLSEWLNTGPVFFSWLFRLCVVAEFFRLYYTILSYKLFLKPRRSPESRPEQV